MAAMVFRVRIGWWRLAKALLRTWTDAFSAIASEISNADCPHNAWSGGGVARQTVRRADATLLGHAIRQAELRDGRVHLRLVTSEGAEREVWTDHIIAATGYRVDTQTLTFLSQSIRAQLDSIRHSPLILSPQCDRFTLSGWPLQTRLARSCGSRSAPATRRAGSLGIWRRQFRAGSRVIMPVRVAAAG